MGSESGGGAANQINKISTNAAGQVQNLAGGMPGQNLGQQYLPELQRTAQQQFNLTNNGDASAGRYWTSQASGAGTGVAGDVLGFSKGLIPYAQQVGEMGFDPQKQLYDRTLQQVQEQQRVGQSARGIAMSPYGAGLEGDATRNFNIDWQNQQLKRATDAATSMEGLGASAFNLGSGATDLMSSAGRLPYQYEQGLLQDQGNAFSNVGGQIANLNQPRQQTISDYLQAAGLGPSYTQAAAQSQNAGTNQMSSLASIPLSLIGKH